MARPRKTAAPSKVWPLIRTLKRKGGKVVYQVDTRSLNGKQPKFRLLEQAEAHAEAMRRQLANTGLEGFNITTTQREDAKNALDKLAKAGLNGVRLEEVVGFYILHNRPEAGEITLANLRDKFLDNRRADGVRPVTIKGIQGRLKQFVKAIGGEKLVTEITEADIREFLDRPDICNQNRRNDYSAISAMFEFAMRPKDYHGRDTKPDAPLSGWVARNPLISIRRAKVEDDKEPAVMDAESAAAMLRSAYETRENPADKPDSTRVGMLAEVVLELFVGVRPDSEIPHLLWSDIEYRGKGATLNIRKSKNKAGKRNINLPPIVVEWLRLCPKQEGPIHIAKNYRRRWDLLKKRAGLKEWKQDILRHTAASVHYRLGQDAGKTRALLGHSISETGSLFGHYRAVMSDAAAKKIMALTPAAVLGTPDNIVSIGEQRRAPKSSPSPKSSRKEKLVAAN
jgi:integrase